MTLKMPIQAGSASSERARVECNDRELIARIEKGDETALAELMRQYGPQVFATAMQVLRLRPEAQEVAQDVFWAVWRSPKRFESARGALITWLVILSRSRALDLLRRIRSETKHLEKTEPWTIDSAQQLPKSRDQNLVFEELLARLPDEQRWMLQKVYFEGLTIREIAILRGIPLGTAKNRAKSAVRQLRFMFVNGTL